MRQYNSGFGPEFDDARDWDGNLYNFTIAFNTKFLDDSDKRLRLPSGDENLSEVLQSWQSNPKYNFTDEFNNKE